MSNGGTRGKNHLSALVWELDIPREKRKAPLGSTKSASPEFSPVGWSQSKMIRENQLLFMIHNKILRNGSLWVALYSPAIRAILWKSREEWQNPLCASICAIIIHQGKWEKEGNEQEGLLPLTLTPSAELAVPLLCYTSISTPPTSSHSYPAPVPDTGAQEGKKIQQWNLKNQDWSVKKCQKEFIIGTN